MKQITAVLAASVLLSAGCTSTSRNASSAGAKQATPPPYVQCVGELVEFEPDYPWFENWVEEDGTEVHGDGSAPRATFRVSSPSTYVNRMVGVLYKYEGKDLPPPPTVTEKGKRFSFELPEDFFTGKYGTIDNIHVRNMKKMP